MTYDASEQYILIAVFCDMLRGVTKDGGEKRARGEKPPWWRDPSHEAAIFSHLNKWKHGEVADTDSGEHPLVHAAWRCLAIAYQESRGKRNPDRELSTCVWVVPKQYTEVLHPPPTREQLDDYFGVADGGENVE